MNPFRYIIVSPVRNEAAYLPLTITSVAAQTLRPDLWVIVDDGSTDRTGTIINGASQQHSWIQGVHRADRGARKAGSGVMEAFYDGFERAQTLSWDFVVKLDGDLSFAPSYFESCLEKFGQDDSLGIAGGTCCATLDGQTRPEFTGEPPFHVRGPCKIYRRKCFEEIGGLVVAPGWDTVDLIEANRLGWRTRTFSDIHLVHHRPTGGAYGSWSNWVKNGMANYITGYHPAFMFLKALSRTFKKPYGVAGAGLLAGFLKGYFKRDVRPTTRATIRYLRDQQLKYLTGRPSLWRPEAL